jgi:hypothetical protein
MKTLMSVVALIALIGWGCSRRPAEQAASAQSRTAVADATAPVVQISVSPRVRLRKPLEMQWKILNTSTQPVYIYSSLLQQPNTYFAEIVVDFERKTIEVRFLSLRTLELSPNYFPKTEFIRIDPGQSQAGQFVSYHSLEKLIREQSTKLPITKRNEKPGTWKVRSLVAYGDEIGSVQKAVAKLTASGTGHPINPVVEWQKVAYSEPVSITLE